MFVLGEVLALFDAVMLKGLTVFILLVLLSVLYFAWMKGRGARLLLPFLVVACMGFFRADSVRSLCEAAVIPESDGFFTGTIASMEEKGENLVLTLQNCQGKAGIENLPLAYKRVLVYIKMDTKGQGVKTETASLPQLLRIGMKVTAEGSMSPFSGARNPGEFDYRLYYRSVKVDCRLFGEKVSPAGDGYSPYLDFLYRIKSKAAKKLDDLAEPEDSGIMKAAILGAKADLDQEVRDLYQKNGIAHLLAISGLHLSIIGGGFYGILKKTGMGYVWSAVLGGMAVVSYGILTGGSSSVVRAVVMLLCLFLANSMGRTYDLLSAVSLAGILLLWDSPYLIFQGGFQLSFGAVLSVGWLYPKLALWIKPGKAWQKTVLVAISIQLMTGPMIFYHFFQYPAYGILLNLIVVPLMGIVVCSGIGAVVFGWFFPALGVLCLGAGHYVLLLYEMLCRFTASLPGYTMIWGRPGMGRLLVCCGGLLAAICLLPRFKWKEKSKGPAGALLLLCCFCLFCMRPLPVSGLQAVFLDVGQGDGILLRTRDCTVLVDGGSSDEKDLGKYRLEPFLKSQAVSSVDYAILSHGDLDHYSGLAYLLESCQDIRVKCLILPWLGKGEGVQDRLQKAVNARGGEVKWMKAGDRLTLGKLTITCIHPGENSPAPDKNAQSLVLLTEYKEFHMLLTGDMDQAGEMEILSKKELLPGLMRVQVLKAAHHGSKTSSSQEFLTALSPRWAVISYGEGNSYGHPHREVMDRLALLDCGIYETAKSGAVILRTDGRKIRWETYVK